MCLAVPPNLQGNGYSVPGMATTVVAPLNCSMSRIGGLNDEFRSPPHEIIWHRNNRDGNTTAYSSNPEKAKAYGIGNLFVQSSNNIQEQLEFMVVIHVSDQNLVAISHISDWEVCFGKRQVSFSSEGNFNVINSNPLNLTPPSSPSNLEVQ